MATNWTERQEDWLIQPIKGARSYSPVPLFPTLCCRMALLISPNSQGRAARLSLPHSLSLQGSPITDYLILQYKLRI